MEYKENNISEQINRFTGELIDNLINTPDTEILKKIKENYGDSGYVANTVREIFKKSKIKLEW